MKELLKETVETIDDVFGDGYAKEHPDLVASMLKDTANRSIASTIATGLWQAAREIPR